ncbi:plasmid mobilization relaxosome protein MobC [Vibrio europaeus]|uniref:Plasmid mobilization relaxosome protein MobC n=1 Tax=Vibrio europaeus TaxID=300876 RepID=A0AAE7AXN4_9VIBR|nr:plasmid mobilization relaxosome protein MobC [Vibrio europaeus]QJY37649.1 plasmid mobilization relaxosome protein MobC [Vibrio europaeus]
MDNEIEKEKKPRRKSIKIRLDDDLYDDLHEFKLIYKCKDWEDLIIRLMSETKGIKKVQVDQDGKALKYINSLQRAGTNLNQIAKVANTNGQIDDHSFEEFQKLSHKIKRARIYFCKNVIPVFYDREE